MKIENCQMHGQVSQDSFFWMKGHLTDIHGPGGDWRGNKQPQDPTMFGQICGSICLMHRNAKRRKNGLSRNQSSIMPVNYVASSSLNLRMRTSRTSWKNARRKLENPMPAAMPCRTPKSSGGETYCGIGKTRRNMLVLSKLTSPRKFDWKELLVGIMRILLQRKE